MISIEKYTTPTNMWMSIKKYMLDKKDLYDINSTVNDTELLNIINSTAHSTFNNSKEYDRFFRAMKKLQTGDSICLSRKNLQRLCFALKITSVNEANNLFLNYLHVNELSARSLDEFIIICGLKCNMTPAAIFSLQDRYKQQIDHQHLAPIDMLTPDQTQDFIINTIEGKIHTKDDFMNYLQSNATSLFFSKTRNLHYFALFDDIIISVDNGKVSFIDDHTITRDEITLRTKSNKLQMKQYYNKLFHLHSLDGDCSDNYLNDNEVKKLINVFRDVFMTNATFNDLVQRKRAIDISAGTYLLHILLTIDPQAINLVNQNIFIDSCNFFLTSAGFPILNIKNNRFDALVIDTHTETLNAYPDLNSDEFKKYYLFTLRNNLKLIAQFVS